MYLKFSKCSIKAEDITNIVSVTSSMRSAKLSHKEHENKQK